MTPPTTRHLTERERNRVLRRVDWRFLLEQPVVDRVLCLAGGELREGCRLMATHVDDAAGEQEGMYDVIVAQDPDDHTLAMASGHLRAGGALYVEWWAGARNDAIGRRLAAAGFGDVRLYWPWPAPPNAEVWVPLDAAAAFDDYLTADRHVYSGWRHRLGTRARRMLASWRLESGRTAPFCSLARAPSAGSVGLDGEPPIVQAAHTALGHGDSTARLTWALLTGGPRAISKVVGLVYADGDPGPAFIVKWPRVVESAGGLAREAEALAACHARAGAPGVPRLLARCGAGEHLAIAETAARGVPMFTRVSPSTFASLARHGARWLSDFHDAHRGGVDDAGTWTARTDRAISRFAESFTQVVETTLIDDTSVLLARLGAPTPVIEHRDFGPWNIFVDETRAMTVLDWESSYVPGLPLLDLIYFITYMAFFVDGAMASRRFIESYRATLDPRSATGAVRAELMAEYRARFGISDDAERALRVLCWMEHADSEFQRFEADAGGPPSAEALGTSVFVQLWKEELAAVHR